MVLEKILLMAIAGCFTLGSVVTLWNLPDVDPSERAFLRLGDGVSPSIMEEREREILHAAKEELDRFPISVGDDENGQNPDWETILHPGTEALQFLGDEHNETEEEGFMRVPKFWDPEPFRNIADERERHGGTFSTDSFPGVRRYLGNVGSRLMTTQEAKSVGSRVASEENNGELLETIFVSIASYRDWQCSSTVDAAFRFASHPERIRVAVVDQIDPSRDTPCSVPPDGTCDEAPDQATCRYRSQIDYFTMDARLALGPVFARHLASSRMYRGEFFAMQLDAHVMFVADWDDDIVEQWHSAENEMAVLSTYPSYVEDHVDAETGMRLTDARPIMCNSYFENDGEGSQKHLRHGQQPEETPDIHGCPTLQPFWAAGFSFARGHFVVNVPYDQHLPWVFQGEEISMGLRGFS